MSGKSRLKKISTYFVPAVSVLALLLAIAETYIATYAFQPVYVIESIIALIVFAGIFIFVAVNAKHFSWFDLNVCGILLLSWIISTYFAVISAFTPSIISTEFAFPCMVKILRYALYMDPTSSVISVYICNFNLCVSAVQLIASVIIRLIMHMSAKPLTKE